VPSSVTYIDLHFAIDSAMVVFPELISLKKSSNWSLGRGSRISEKTAISRRSGHPHCLTPAWD
jgi:hypothetical protein